MFCGNCGANNLPDQRFCFGCGKELIVVQATTSTGAAAAPAVARQQIFESVTARLRMLASTEKLEGFSLKEMFSEVFRKRSQEQIDEYFITGTTRTTPSIDEVETGWPKPWFFMRVLTFVGIIYFGFFYAVEEFQNTNLIPGLIMMGSLAVPLATVFLFFELNTPRNVSFHRVLMLVCFGGIVSLTISLAGFSMASLDWLGASAAGIVEETGKLLAVVLVVRGNRYRYILNGMLFGAAVGAGFAIFESAGYAFNSLLNNKSLDAMTANIQMRAMLSPFGHVAWTAISAAALWRARNGQPLKPQHFLDPGFLKAFCIPVALHMIWNAPLPSPFYARHLALGAIGWFVVFGMVQQGLRQVREEQREVATSKLTTMRIAVTPQG
jgi:RsiW-degrading membrane proteinase PrsW (M82 family)